MPRKIWFFTLALTGLLCAHRPDTAWSKPVTSAFNITPFLSCIDVNDTTGAITAYFGYESFESAEVTILVGGENRFLPPPSNRQQPAVFYPGLHERAFRITYPVSNLVWLFNGFGVTVTPGSPRCTPPPVVADIVPFVESVTVSDATATATFGYQNAASNTITIAAGSPHNRLSRTANQNQPTQFLPGLQRNVFTTTFPASEALYWMVQGLPALAVPGTCPTITVRVR
ncbi:MAG: hypothetical protein HYR56_28120 [Acidobacteria bacterium]|nr:hypothetical protein [Acidobacteriota bacterium]MBI3422512.1 hypothetical protein [Acidobacteriota bacterium]